MKPILYLRGDNRLAAREVKIHLGNRPIAALSSIQNVESPVVPSAARGAALAGVASIADNSPQVAFERPRRQGFERIEQTAVANLPCT